MIAYLQHPKPLSTNSQSLSYATLALTRFMNTYRVRYARITEESGIKEARRRNLGTGE